MRADLFDFHLPPERIALEPARPRDTARLLHARADGTCADHRVRDLPGLLRPGDLLVVNNTRVIPAALQGVRPARGDGADVQVEAMLHKRAGADVWIAFARPGKRLRIGDAIHFSERLSATVDAKTEDGEVRLRFNAAGDALDAAIAATGHTPLPPYILARRPRSPSDADDYQTLFAERAGAAAAPTAGLHFTPDLMAALETQGVETVALTLHVGAGTFLPVKAEDTDDHRMHAEWFEITDDVAARINAARARGGRVVAIGTTALRALESAAAEDGRVGATAQETSIFITPGYRFRAVDLLWTNFHLPRSTLFMLICAFVGLERAHAIYAHAIANDYRFYSFGDASLLERADA